MADDLLPTFRGGRSGNGCPNPECEASDSYLRVMSTEEMDRIFPLKSELNFTPIPPQATHVCDSCGHVFSGMDERVSDISTEDPLANRPDVDIDEYAFDIADVHEEPARDVAIQLVEGAPDGTQREEFVEAIERFVPGLGSDDAQMIFDAADRDVPDKSYPADEFM